jgi:flagellum-specific ATP synthase
MITTSDCVRTRPLLRDPDAVAALCAELREAQRPRIGGYLTRCSGATVACRGLARRVGIGSNCLIERAPAARRGGTPPFDPEGGVLAEVVGFDGEDVRLLPYAETAGIRPGARVTTAPRWDDVAPGRQWLGRVLDPFAQPLDGQRPPVPGARRYALRARPIPAHERALVGDRIELGVRALDLFTPCCKGQRLGIFAGSGVGKSTLLSMIGRDSQADALVVGLIGERGRELNEFLHRTLSREARARSVVIVATSDMPAMLRRRGAYLTLTVAEALRDLGLNVICMLDSVTRFAMALREIHLAAGEVPTSKGYPPSVFAELPQLLERAGPGRAGSGSITGLFTVLVEGDDPNEPVTDTVRGILDGHVVLDRAIAEGGRFPAVDVLRSISRTAPDCYRPDEREVVRRARRLMRAHADIAELIRLGAYKRGADALVDEAIEVLPAIEEILRQEPDQPPIADSPFAHLAAALGDSSPRLS